MVWKEWPAAIAGIAGKSDTSPTRGARLPLQPSPPSEPKPRATGRSKGIKQGTLKQQHKAAGAGPIERAPGRHKVQTYKSRGGEEKTCATHVKPHSREVEFKEPRGKATVLCGKRTTHQSHKPTTRLQLGREPYKREGAGQSRGEGQQSEQKKHTNQDGLRGTSQQAETPPSN